MLRPLLLASASALIVSACASAPPVLPGQAIVMATMETAPAGARGDAADDPALWLNPQDAAKSLILGTNKQEGLVIYALDGTEAARLPIGLINNVDIRQSADRPYDVVLASNDEVNAISVFLIDRATGTVSHRGEIPTNKLEPYGICSAREEGRDFAGVTYKDGTVEIWAISAGPSELAGQLLKTVKLETQLEGCVFDEPQGILFVGEEGRGLWKMSYRDEVPAPELIDEVGGEAGLVADVEGVTLWRGKGEQAEDRFVIYDRQAPHSARGSFSVTANPALGIDAVTHTDGLDAFSGALPGYPRGIVIMQDDGNPKSGRDQNFKVVNWEDVEVALGLPALASE
jgi:3-phytase